MNIFTITPNLNMQGRLVPLKDFKGPILKLTKKDKEQISQIEAHIQQYEQELIKLESCWNAARNTRKEDSYDAKIKKLESFVAEARMLIENIKINRLNKQKAKLAKKKLDTIV